MTKSASHFDRSQIMSCDGDSLETRPSNQSRFDMLKLHKDMHAPLMMRYMYDCTQFTKYLYLYAFDSKYMF